MAMRKGMMAASLWMGALAGVSSATAVAAKNWSDWSLPASIETLPRSSDALNGPSLDGCASLSPDGLTLAFNSFRSGNQQIYLARRESTAEGFGDPVPLDAVNTPFLESCPTLTRGNRLYFTSSRADAGDLYVSKYGPKGWSAPERLGPTVNTPGTVEESATFYEDEEGREVMLFSRRPPGPLVGPGGRIFQSIDGGPAEPVGGGVHSQASDNRPSVTQDGRQIFWDSLRGGTLRVWTATRTSQGWDQAVSVDQMGAATRPSVSPKGEMLLLGLNGDIYFSARERVSNADKD